MKICKGKYIVFVDSDDLLYDENSIQYLIETCKVEDSDVGVCNFQKLKGTKCVAKLKDVKDVISGKDSIIAYLEEDKFHCAVWNKIYKKALLEGVTFDEKTRICEDIEFTYIIANKAKKISRDTTKYVYKYFVREVSLTESKFSEKALDEIDNIKKAVDAIQKDYPDLEKLSIRRYQRSIVSVLCKALKSNGNIKGYEYLMDEIEKWPIELVGYNKVRYYMLKHCQWMLRLIYMLYYKMR
jgi:translation initiation factor 2 beta subunit (eIF-2beta)/eIF-5